MSYDVHWTEAAPDDLSRVWLTAPNRNAVTTASHRLEQALARDPYGIGFARNASVNRTAVEPPLGIDYEIIEDDRRVRVLRA